MDSMVKVRVKALEIATSLRDVSSENVVDVADKVAKYIKRDADIPEYVSADKLAADIMDKAMQFIKEDPVHIPPMPGYDEFLAQHTNYSCEK